MRGSGPHRNAAFHEGGLGQAQLLLQPALDTRVTKPSACQSNQSPLTSQPLVVVVVAPTCTACTGRGAGTEQEEGMGEGEVERRGGRTETG